MKMFNFLLPLLILSACSSRKESDVVYSSNELQIKSLGKNVFVHISYLTTNDFGKVECNGMIYFNNQEAIVFDTPTTNQVSEELINWIEREQGKELKAIVVTHFHNDCLGGLKQFHTNGTKSYASNKTIELAQQTQVEVIPETGFDTHKEFKIGDEIVYSTHYGAGHTQDNIVGYIPSEEVLFGGCLIKTMNASKGFLGDADTLAWSNTVGKIKTKLPHVKLVIPGHGNTGGKELLDYTIQLFQHKEQ